MGKSKKKNLNCITELVFYMTNTHNMVLVLKKI